MSPQSNKNSKSTKSHNHNQTQNPQKQQQQPRSSLSSHLAMVELMQRIRTSLSKLSDRDTHQIAVEDLEKTINSLSPDAIPMILNSLYEASADPKPAVKKESIRLLTVVCSSHADSVSTHLTKIMAYVIRRLKDSDSGVRDACRDAVGALAAQYLRGDSCGGDNGGNGSMVALFVKPLFEATGEQNKSVQAGAAICMAKMVESAVDTPVSGFQKMCPRICKLINNPNFLAKAAILPVVASLSQVGAIAPQSLEHLLASIHDCLTSSDWATRKAAAEALSSLALHSSSLITDRTASTLSVLESCRFDKIKPVRDSMNEALQLWKKIAGKGDGSPDDSKPSSHGGESPEPATLSETNDPNKVILCEKKTDASMKVSPSASSNMDSTAKAKAAGISEKAVVILKKKAPVLTDKELNPEFFQKLQRRGSDDLPVEVVVPRRCLNSSSLNNKEESETSAKDSKERVSSVGNIPRDEFHGSSNNKYPILDRANDRNSKQLSFDDFTHERFSEKRVNAKELRTKAYVTHDRNENDQREGSANVTGFSKTDGQSELSFSNNKGNWLAIQRPLMLLERQQVHLMNMLQDFMGGSHDSMMTLENRVRGLERIVEDMARDLSLSSGHRGSNFTGFEGSSSRPSGKYNGFNDYSSAKYGRGGDGCIPFGERFAQSDGNALGTRGRGPPWRSDLSEAWDFSGYSTSRNGQIFPKRASSPKSMHESDQGVSRRAWDKAAMPIRFGEGPSARSVWQASKDEATLEAIRVAGEDNGTSRATRVPMPEMTAEALADDNVGEERDAIWTSWSNAMHALQVGDIDSAFAEVLSSADDLLLVKLMDRTGPVIDQLSSEIICEILHAIGQFLLEQNLYDICLSWIQQLVELILENGPDTFGIPMEAKKGLLLNLHEASTDIAEEWEGVRPDQLLLQLASAWEIDLQQHDK
ncbi:PREDICTED: microtubule-associated protein TORTIFOLIA1-like [Lupinus angustifolius]|uniref:microtubule-associated protein TORTIFOLIA1-like n=1 Tax=Lupinus angustifolius TaxID=3871 RepID=UPI00092FD0C7|nr:PREDICTED: microtubule-associated protein TORTIFOLIA1-like [Lupinus angustifolius]